MTVQTGIRIVTTAQGRLLARLTGYVALFLLALAGMALLIRLGRSTAWVSLASRSDLLSQGVERTMLISGFSTCTGLLLAFLAAAIRLEGPPAAAALMRVYGTVFRGTPLLIQLYLVYYGAGEFSADLRAAGLWWFFREPINCVLLVFTLNTAAYQAEVLWGAVRCVNPGQNEAARALGLTKWQAYRTVILPQAWKLALRPIGNEWCKMLKASAIASIVTVIDILGAARIIYSETLDFDVFIAVAIFFIAAVEVVRLVVDRLERLIHHDVSKAKVVPESGASS